MLASRRLLEFPPSPTFSEQMRLSPYRVFCIPQQLEDGNTAGAIRHSVRGVSVL